ncbi:MAG: copper-binding protein [Phycisphaerales bacterium]|nr:copper-binding protein [Phycisphaerales bacterium]
MLVPAPAFSTRTPVRVFSCLAFALILSACEKPAPAPPPPVIKGAVEATYTVRGRVIRLPNPPLGYLVVHHAPIPNFVNRLGKEVGMEEMEMDFAWVAPGALDGISAGDPVELTFEVRWRGEPPTLVTKAAKLGPAEPLGIRE